MNQINENHAVKAIRAVNNLPDKANVYLKFIDGKVKVSIFAHSRPTFREVRRAVGKVDKVESTGGMKLRASQLGGIEDVAVTIFPPSDVCKRVQVGTTTQPVTAETGETREVPVYEWECEGVLVDG